MGNKKINAGFWEPAVTTEPGIVQKKKERGGKLVKKKFLDYVKAEDKKQ